MSLVTATHAEIASVQKRLEGLRTELMRHADHGVRSAGFQKTDEAAMACMMVLFGACQRYALQSRQHFEIFKALAKDMSESSAEAIIQRASMEMGPEVMGDDPAPSIIRPGQL